MKNDAGKDDILRFIYDEMSPDEIAEAETRLQIDSEFRDMHDDIKDVQEELDKL
ncbi:MAG: hypothetical protein RL151_1534, partial [Bacteroidota bacterium]